MREFFWSVERRLALTTFPSSAVVRMTLVPARYLLEYIARLTLGARVGLASLKVLKGLKNSKEDLEVLLIANGPSAKALDVSKVTTLQENRTLEVFVMNNFFQSELAAQLKPDAYILSDPQHNWLRNQPLGMAVRKYLQDCAKTLVFIPRHWTGNCQDKCPNLVHYEDLSLESISRNISPLRPRGYPSLTALKALAVAIYLGYRRVHVIGLDNNLFLGLKVDSQNRLFQGAHHMRGAATVGTTDITKFYPNGTSDYFFDLALTLFTLRRFAKRSDIRNLDPNSITDAFFKVDELGLIKGEVH